LAEARRIDQRIQQGWSDYGLEPARSADPQKWLRRVFLDVLGRIPTVEELDRFGSAKSPVQREALLDELLDSPTYAPQYARHFAATWTNLLVGRSGGTERNSLTHRRGLEIYLEEAFQQNKPYDQLVSELVTATGSNTPGQPNFNGAVNFLTMKLDEKASLATAQTARLFLGMQIQCTQCHNHPFNEWKQRKYWELNAFFRQTRALRRFDPGTRQVASAELVNQDFAGEGETPLEAECYYELRNGILQVAYPVFIDGRAIARSGYLDDVNRRRELGKFIVDSEYLAQAIVNRMWSHFLGYGFTRPVDDMGPHNPPSHPELLVQLSEQFREADYDLKKLIRWIVLTEAYGLSSDGNGLDVGADDPTLGEPPKFSRFYLRQMTPEQLYDSVWTATRGKGPGFDGEADWSESRQQWLSQFTRSLGNDEGEEVTTFNGGIPQILMMLNGQFVREATTLEQGKLIWRVSLGRRRFTDKADYVFRAALARRPNRSETAMVRKMAASRGGNEPGALQDLLWALLNSNFLLFDF
jgi:hypothetical protein